MSHEVKAPLVGKVIEILVEEGDEVSKEDSVIILEAMKVEVDVNAPADGTVKSIAVSEEQTVERGGTLLVIE